MTDPVLSLAELRTRYDALGALSELPGERTFITRCLTFDEFVESGSAVADDFNRLARTFGDDELADIREAHPGLFDLIREAWSGAKPKEG